VVHRDLKPENVLISSDPDGHLQARILDFGLAKLTQTVSEDSNSPTAAAPLTVPGVTLGTFGYMSAEQLICGTVDERSDLFSIGVMVVEVLTGRRPFSGTTYQELLASILQGSCSLPADSGAAPLAPILRRCFARERAARFRSAAELQAVLIPALERCTLIEAEPAAEPDAETFTTKP
jgi:serine/threonine protein kinase